MAVVSHIRTGRFPVTPGSCTESEWSSGKIPFRSGGEAVLQGEADYVANGSESEFLHDAATVGIHRVHADFQLRSDVFRGLALGQHLQDLPLAIGDLFERMGYVLLIIV